MKEQILLNASGLVKEFHTGGGTVHAVSDVDLIIYKGETLSLVGESGCGKSTLGRLLLRLIEPTQGSVVFNGVELSTLKKKEMREMRRKMQFIFQDPYASLNPRMTVGKILQEPLINYQVGKEEKQENKPKEIREDIIKNLMKKVGIRPEYYNRYPHQFSGGQRQRIGIARALALNPELIVCDEPVSALDVSIQAQILNLLHDLQEELGLTYLFISHDLSVVRYISDRVCVMFLGRVCEIGKTEDIYKNPMHPYTKFLLDSVPQPDPRKRREDKEVLEGDIPSPLKPPAGCRFHTRCPYARDICKQEVPQMKDYENGRQCACHFPLNN